ncbi:hypothetical protein V1264_005079 [Littorina saxatilis]|uniref:Uncharacterized protein n=1 Tax=Littorina saxatilis TaxID=31220 RepID=A0AAN9G6J5_9CAEN
MLELEKVAWPSLDYGSVTYLPCGEVRYPFYSLCSRSGSRFPVSLANLNAAGENTSWGGADRVIDYTRKTSWGGADRVIDYTRKTSWGGADRVIDYTRKTSWGGADRVIDYTRKKSWGGADRVIDYTRKTSWGGADPRFS